MSLTTYLGVLVAAFLAGTVAHELAHYVAARLAGVRARIVVVRAGLATHPETRFTKPPTALAEWVIRLAPAAAGTLAAVAWLATQGAVLPAGGIVLAFWLPLTVLGGASDYSAAVSRGETSGRAWVLAWLDAADEPAWRQQTLLWWFASMGAFFGIWGLYTVAVGLPRVVWYAAFSTLLGLALGAGLVAARTIPEARYAEVSAR